MNEKTIPHEHHCTVCKAIEGCDEKYCKREVWDVCDKPACVSIYKAATVHVYTDGEILPCCGRHRLETPGDRMTTDPARVTCKGRAAAAGDPSTVPALSSDKPKTPGHVPGCLCYACEPPPPPVARAGQL